MQIVHETQANAEFVVGAELAHGSGMSDETRVTNAGTRAEFIFSLIPMTMMVDSQRPDAR